DFRLDGSRHQDTIKEIQLNKQRGLRTGLVQMAHYDFSIKKEIDDSIRQLVDGEQVQMIVYGEYINADVMLIKHPGVFEEYQEYVPAVEAKIVRGVLESSPGQLRQYTRNASEYAGKEVKWYPVNDAVRETIKKRHIRLTAENWSDHPGMPDDWIIENDLENRTGTIMAGDYKKKRSDGSSLLKALIQTEAEIDKPQREKSRADKRTRQIKSSRTYQSAGPLKKLESKNRREEEISMLETELEAVKDELRKTKEALHLAKLDDASMSSIKVRNSVREMKSDAALMDYMEKAVVQKKQHEKNYNDALTYAGRLFMNAQDDYRRAVYSTLLSGLKIEDI